MSGLRALARAVRSGGAGRELAERGFAVVDGSVPASFVSRARAEVRSMRAAGRMAENCTHMVLGGGGGVEFMPKRGVFEAEAVSGCSEEWPELGGVFDDLELLAALEDAGGDRLVAQTVKAQVNDGDGACFPLHFDTDGVVDSRRFTCIVYLNEAWRDGDGGELRLYPFPGPAVDVQPLAGRAVLFDSYNMLHRVLPSHAERCCFTVWLYGDGAPPPAGPPGGTVRACPKLAEPRLWKHFARLSLADEWRRSLQESHPPSPALDAALERDASEIEVIRGALLRAACGGDEAVLDAALREVARK